MSSNTTQDNRFLDRTTTRTDLKNLCFFHARFGPKARKCRAPFSWQPRNSRNLDNNISYRVASYSCRLRRKALSTHQSLFYDPCSKMSFLPNTGAEISMIPPCRCYKPYYGQQDLVTANGTPIQIFGTKKLNIDVGARYTLWWTFEKADVAVPIIGTDFLRHFGLGVVVGTMPLFRQITLYRRHHASRQKAIT